MKQILNRVKNVTGYLWMIASVAVAVMLFSSIGTWEKRLVDGTGIKVNTKYTGGEVLSTVDHVTYHTIIHRPVFEDPPGGSKKGFIQIDWMQKGTSVRGPLPATIEEHFDYDHDGKTDFTILLDTIENKARLLKNNPHVLAILDRSSMVELTMKGYPDGRFGVFTHKDGRSVRVLLRNDR